MINAQTLSLSSPFAMLIDPERVVRAMEHSERLNRLHSRVYRPLDKPLIAKNAVAAADFDRLIEDAADEGDDGIDLLDASSN